LSAPVNSAPQHRCFVRRTSPSRRTCWHIVDSKTTDFDPLTFRDRYEEALLAH
jgi:hypothetical protein